MNPPLTIEQKLRQFDSFTALYAPIEYKQLLRDISDELTKTLMRVEWANTDLARLRLDLRRAQHFLSNESEETLSVVPAGQQMRGVDGEISEG